MKNRYIVLLIISALAALFATSCNKFLDEMPDNRTSADTKDKLAKLLVSAYSDRTYALYTNYMSDDHDDIGTRFGGMSDYETFMVQAWNWETIENEEDDDTPFHTWQAYYKAISTANQVLATIAEQGNPEDLDAQRGEALICRAYAHFKLVNVFCHSYSNANAATDLGIPYMETPLTEVLVEASRGTVKEVYEKIERDVVEGLPLLDDNAYLSPKYHFTRQAANAFAAEFYLFYKKYDKAIAHADVVLGQNPSAIMRDVTGWTNTTAMPADVEVRGLAYIDETLDANLLLQPVFSAIGLTTSNYYYGKRFLYSDVINETEVLASLSSLWDTTSPNEATFYLRAFTFSSTPSMPTRLNIPYIFEYTDPVAEIGFRHSVLAAYTVENSLLVRAEANVMKSTPDYAAAMADINIWLAKRVNSSYYSPKTESDIESYYGSEEGIEYYTSTAPTPKKRMNPETPFADNKQEAFIHALLHIRRIEFWGEGSRWFDVKRYNIEITRRQYRLTPGVELTEVDRLSPRDKRMAIQLPLSVIAAGMEANPR